MIGNGQAGAAAQEVVLKSWRRVQGEVYETWSSCSVGIDNSRAPEPVELKDEESGLSISGQRLRLKVRPDHFCVQHLSENMIFLSHEPCWQHECRPFWVAWPRAQRANVKYAS